MNPMMKVMAKVHTTILRISGGRIGNKMGGNDVLLLHHVGAKSGKYYATPLAYIAESGGYAVVAAAAGQPNHPGWFYNLQKTPETTIEIKGTPIPVIAEIAPKATRDRIWTALAAEFPQYNKFQQMTSRTIPIILLHPQTR
jgi:deazaflavin-dependent oxidoreductase (nitroreductase family)